MPDSNQLSATLDLPGDPLSGRNRAGIPSALRVLPTGALIPLPLDHGVLWMGRDPRGHIVLDDPYVPRRACALERHEHGRLFVRAHRTDAYAASTLPRVNDAAVAFAELAVGATLEVGATAMLVLGDDETLRTQSLDSMIRWSVRAHGSSYRAAPALGVSPSSAHRWARQGGRRTPEDVSVLGNAIPELVHDPRTVRVALQPDAFAEDTIPDGGSTEPGDDHEGGAW